VLSESFDANTLSCKDGYKITYGFFDGVGKGSVNLPSNAAGAGTLEIRRHGGHIWQEYRSLLTGKIYYRKTSDVGATWVSWTAI